MLTGTETNDDNSSRFILMETISCHTEWLMVDFK